MAKKTQLHVTRPTDKSFEAYVSWIKATCKGLGVPYTTSEQRARANWRKFWASAADAK